MEGQDGKDQGTSRPPTPEHEPEHVIEPLTPGHPSALAGGSAEERFITQLTRELERVARPRNLRPLAIHHPAPIPEEEEEGPAQEEEAPQEEEALQEEEAPQEEEALQEEEAPQEEEAAQEEEALQEEEAAQEEEAPQEEEAAQEEEEEEEEEEAAQEEEEAAQEEEDFSEDDAIEEVFQHIYAMEVRSHRNPSGDSPSVTWDEFEEAVLAEAEQLEDVPLDLEVLAENMMHLGLADEELQADNDGAKSLAQQEFEASKKDEAIFVFTAKEDDAKKFDVSSLGRCLKKVEATPSSVVKDDAEKIDVSSFRRSLKKVDFQKAKDDDEGAKSLALQEVEASKKVQAIASTAKEDDAKKYDVFSLGRCLKKNSSTPKEDDAEKIDVSSFQRSLKKVDLQQATTSDLQPYLNAVRVTLDAALCLLHFSSQVSDCLSYPEVEIRLSPELLLRPVVISRSMTEKVLIEGSINSARVSICVKQADDMEKWICKTFIKFMTKRAEDFRVLRRKAIPGYDISFLITNRHTDYLPKRKIVGLVLDFMQEINKEVKKMKLLLNARARLIAEEFFKQF
ncbi:hypothetical protein LSTR_LSTR008148 [Laodelphax striatellus]|uniref:Actin-related protein 2/3 complex subunit 4 n=1 Tax=Laodelphax striatellus TaxID=195883 RepID=A0A482WZ38_LAOST|nr:hypothetical protein LSTR_LSTR008148 [Laodelphax striatellus]